MKGLESRKVVFYAGKGKCTFAYYESEPRERTDMYVVCMWGVRYSKTQPPPPT